MQVIPIELHTAAIFAKRENSLHFQKICPARGVTRRAHLGLHFPCRSFAWTCIPARANLQSIPSHACVDRIHHFHDLCILGMLPLVVKERKLH